MNLTWSVTGGGALCKCGHLKASHRDGKFECVECEKPSNRVPFVEHCLKFEDRAEVGRAA